MLCKKGEVARMNNDDFKALVSAGSLGDRSIPRSVLKRTRGREGTKMRPLAAEKRREIEASDLRKSRRLEAEIQKVDGEGSYRDRAYERRNGAPSELDAFASTVDAEKSKFLGGSIESTHLVKGLDFSLLAKVRQSVATSASVFAGMPPGIPVRQGPIQTLNVAGSSPVAASAETKTDDIRRTQSNSVTSEIGVRLLAYLGTVCRQENSDYRSQRSLSRTLYAYSQTQQHFALPVCTVSSSDFLSVVSSSDDRRTDTSEVRCAVAPTMIAALARSHSRSKGGCGGGMCAKDREVSNLLHRVPAISRIHHKINVDLDDIFSDVGDYVPEGALSLAETQAVKKEIGVAMGQAIMPEAQQPR